MMPQKPISAQPHDAIGMTQISQGIEAREFYLAYQPQVNAHNGQFMGFEALLRWDSSLYGPVGPATFISVMEAANATSVIWTYLLDQLANDLAHMNAIRPPLTHVAVNLSAQQLSNPGLADGIEQWLSKHSLGVDQIHVEITESAVLQDSPVVKSNLQHLSELGLALWLDDFGTGYSSLCHLVDLPLKGLKIDQRFIANIDENMSHFRIVAAIVSMADSLGLSTVAEGIETENQLQIVSQLGCTSLQGYLIGQPERMDLMAQRWLSAGDA